MDTTAAGPVDVTSYVPARVARQIAGDPPDSPRADRFAGAVLFADISGFTALTETLGRRGDVGVEDVTRCLNDYFGRLIDVIVAHGGDIIKFAGDALLAIWPAETEPLAASTCRAVQCGMAAQEQLNDFPVTDGVRLSLRIGVSAGPLAILHVGGVDQRWELIATGEPLTGMSAAKEQAGVGEVAMSPESWALVRDRIAGEPLPHGAIRVLGVRAPIAIRPLEPVPVTDARGLLGYVPPAVIDQAGRRDGGLLAELRRVTVLFVNFPGLTPATPLERADAVMRELQTTLYRYEGTINKLSLDEKGASLVAAMGLPPLSHEDDAERAVRAALLIREHLGPMQVRHSTGITTGLAFCGIVGNATRREYTMIGDVVNLAARLMQAAHGGMLCDQATYQAARARLAFETLPSIPVKGKAGEIAVYHPVESAARAGALHTLLTGTVGRVREQQAIDAAFRELAHGQGAVIVFEGMAGIGKSHVVEEAKRRARRAGLRCLEGGADAIEKSTALYVWRNVFDQAFGLDRAAGTDERNACMSARLAELGRPDWIDLRPLLNPVLRTSFPETDATALIADRERASKTYDLLADLLVAGPREGSGLVLLLEDAQWMDSASLTLAARICTRPGPLVIVIAVRPIPGPALEAIEAIARSPRATLFELEPLSGDETVDIACRALGVAAVPDPVAAVIRSKAEGNPLLSQELAGALRDAGLIRVSDGECRLDPAAGDLRSVDLPTSIQGAVTVRLDRLTPSQRQLMKIASVVGRVFESDVVRRLHDPQGDEAAMLGELREIEALHITSLVRSDPAPAYGFRHLAFQEVTYRQMLFSQRRQLHRAVAELLEAQHADGLEAVYPRLALHWRNAVEEGDVEPALIWKAIDYLHKAGEQALRQFANQEAIDFVNGALHLLERLPESLDRSRRELALCCLIGAPLLVMKGFAAPETERAYSRATELCQTLENSPDLFSAVYGLWGFALMKTDLTRARRLARELFRLAQTADDRELLLPANRAMGDTSFWVGELASARTHLAEAVALYRPEHHAREVFRTGQDQGAVSAGLLAWTLWLLGYPDMALATMAETLTLGRRLSHAHTMAMLLQNFTMIHQFRSETGAIADKADTQLSLSREQGFPQWQAAATVMLGVVRSKEGRHDEAIAMMRRGIDDWRSTGAELAAPYYLGLLADAYRAAGNPEAGLAAISDALASSLKSGEAWWRPELWRLEAELRLALPSPDERAAEQRLVDALELARTQQARSLELRVALSLFRLRTKQGQPISEARRSLTDVVNWFTEGQEGLDMTEARRLLSVDPV